MSLLTMESESLRLQVLPEAGASIVSLAVRKNGQWLPLMRETPPEALKKKNSSAMASFILAPFSNRLAEAKFRFEGKTWPLEANAEGGYAIHGAVRKRPWQVASSSPRTTRLTFESASFPDMDFPFPFRTAITYGLDETTMSATISLTNSGHGRMPAGFGFHPYFNRTLADPDELVELQARFAGAYEGLAPTTGPRPLVTKEDFSAARILPAAGFDTCFAGWDGKARLSWPGSAISADIECDDPLRHLILFTPPDESFFALEPVSNANNGFNLLADGIADTGVEILASGQSMAATFRLTVS